MQMKFGVFIVFKFGIIKIFNFIPKKKSFEKNSFRL